MLLKQLFDKESSTYTYLLADETTREAALVDPVLGQLDRDLTLIDELGLTLKFVLETHVHADHVTAAGVLRARTGARTAASAIGAPCVDLALRHSDTLTIGAHAVTVLATPGHTDDGLCFLADGHVMTGDTLLIRGCGRADFQNGDPGTLYDSVHSVLFGLPEDTVVLPGHDYRGFTTSTIGEEKRYNPRLANRNREEFIALMNGLNLPRPKLIDVAVPANRACGEAPMAL
jgi:sulfur dioxygenase